jgi:positive phototaxis protein PixI
MSNASSASDPQSLMRQQDLAAASPSSQSQEFLRLHLVPDTTALLPVKQLTEVLTVSIGQIVPIPHMPAWVMGVYNWRGEILWMVDLGHLCGLTPWYEQDTNISTYSAVVLQAVGTQTTSVWARSQMLGLVVNQIEDMEWCDPALIQPLPHSTLTPKLAPFLYGYWWKSNDDMLAILDGEAILAAMPK